MKCDELKEIMLVNQVSGERTPSGTYKKAEVDEAIAELKAENERLNNALDKERSETIKYMDELCNAKNEIERLTIDKRNAELKAYNVVATADVNPEVVDSLGCTEWLAYDMEEADKVIAGLQSELEAKGQELANLKEDARNTDKARKNWLQLARKKAMEIRHHKYKRCLTMAEKWTLLAAVSPCGKYVRRANKFTELAEKFKEAK